MSKRTYKIENGKTFKSAAKKTITSVMLDADNTIMHRFYSDESAMKKAVKYSKENKYFKLEPVVEVLASEEKAEEEKPVKLTATQKKIANVLKDATEAYRVNRWGGEVRVFDGVVFFPEELSHTVCKAPSTPLAELAFKDVIESRNGFMCLKQDKIEVQEETEEEKAELEENPVLNHIENPPALVGTERQVKWGKDIRTDFIKDMQLAAKALSELGEEPMLQKYGGVNIFEAITAHTLEKKEARFWINLKNDYNIKHARSHLRVWMRKGDSTPRTILEKRNAKQAAKNLLPILARFNTEKSFRETPLLSEFWREAEQKRE